jgi:hypothetical protein
MLQHQVKRQLEVTAHTLVAPLNGTAHGTGRRMAKKWPTRLKVTSLHNLPRLPIRAVLIIAGQYVLVHKWSCSSRSFTMRCISYSHRSHCSSRIAELSPDVAA